MVNMICLYGLLTPRCYVCGCKLNPSTLNIKNGGGVVIGRAEHSFRNFKCCHAVWIDVYVKACEGAQRDDQ